MLILRRTSPSSSVQYVEDIMGVSWERHQRSWTLRGKQIRKEGARGSESWDITDQGVKHGIIRKSDPYKIQKSGS
jgi:hypothetical protein